jgi:hypothetical protein
MELISSLVQSFLGPSLIVRSASTAAAEVEKADAAAPAPAVGGRRRERRDLTRSILSLLRHEKGNGKLR